MKIIVHHPKKVSSSAGMWDQAITNSITGWCSSVFET
jgi:hypothetical protein